MPDDARVAIFIDGSNFYHCLKSETGNPYIDLRKLATKLVGERRLVRTYYYNAALDPKREPEKAKAQQRFLDKVRRMDYVELRLGRLLHTGDGRTVEKGVDIKIAVDMLKLARADVYDVATLVSGDGDLADAVQAVKDMGKHVENAFIATGRSRHLQDVCDRLILMDSAFIEACRQ